MSYFGGVNERWAATLFTPEKMIKMQEMYHLLCRNSGPSSPGGKSAPVSEVDGEDALPPLGDDDNVAAGPATGKLDAAVDATGCRWNYRLVSKQFYGLVKWGQFGGWCKEMERKLKKL